MIQQTKQSQIIYRFQDPVRFCRYVWPQYNLYDKQREILYSVRDNYETIVPAGNELGKDFISGLCVLWFFCTRRPCKIVTTSASGSQLENVLWGEIRRFIDQARFPLPIEYTHLHLYQRWPGEGKRHPNSECVGKVVQKGESMLGMHVARAKEPLMDDSVKRIGTYPTTLLVVDEASGVDDDTYERADTWTHRKLVIGNPYPCTNFFFKGTKEGDLPSERADTGEEKAFRKVIRIKALDSPNIALALYEKSRGLPISHRELIPGLARYSDYLQRRKVWDPIKQCIGLDAEFYEGAEVLLFPPQWLNKAEELAVSLSPRRMARGIGIDPAEGGDYTAFAAVDEHGLIDLVIKKTLDTAEITWETLAFMRQYGLNPEDETACDRVCFDRGGGGRQHADRLRDQGYMVRSIGFGESSSPPIQAGVRSVDERIEFDEQRYVYKNRRAEMYGRLSRRIDPSIEETQFAIPRHLSEPLAPGRSGLRQQLAVIPKLYDGEGRMVLPPKQLNIPKALRKQHKDTNEVTLVDLIGHSPDEADATVLAVYAMEVRGDPIIGAI